MRSPLYSPYVPEPRQSSSLGCVGIFMGVFLALAAMLAILWGIGFYAHIQREQNIVIGTNAEMAQIVQLNQQYGNTNPQRNLRQIENLSDLQTVAKKSQYDPFWFMDGAP